MTFTNISLEFFRTKGITYNGQLLLLRPVAAAGHPGRDFDPSVRFRLSSPLLFGHLSGHATGTPQGGLGAALTIETGSFASYLAEGWASDP